jgi:hypothetical protein
MPREFIEQKRKTMDPRRFNALFGGMWERMAGLVYDCFDEDENQCEPSALPTGTKYVGGIDWGFTEPFVFKVRGITPTDYHFGIDEVYRSGLTIEMIRDIVIPMGQTYDIGAVYCGQDQPGYIEYLNQACSKVRKTNPAFKMHFLAANNDVRMGVDAHYELLRTRRLKYFRGKNKYTLDEIDTYHYPAPEDAKPDDNVKDQKPVQQNDHAMDAERYISIMTGRAQKRRAIVLDEGRPKQETQHSRIERLKRPQKSYRATEEWS